MVADLTSPENASVRFTRQHRLLAAAEYAKVFAARRVLRGDFFDLHYLPAANPEMSADAIATLTARLGLVVAKKLARRAVQRNLLKRIAREAFRHVRCNLPPGDLILRLAKPPGVVLDEAARGRWRRDVDRLLRRLADRTSSS